MCEQCTKLENIYYFYHTHFCAQLVNENQIYTLFPQIFV